MLKFVALFVAICGAIYLPAFAQQKVTKGMVWRVPEDPERARSDLIRMARAGVEAVRTSALPHSSILREADTLGLSLYVDLPIDALPAPHLVDSLDYARAVVDSVVAAARAHPSIQYIGLARRSDTSDSTACRYFEDLSGYIRGSASLRTYYVTRFVRDDVCAHTVDVVLLDLLDWKDPPAALRIWQAKASRETPVGIGALGTWVRADTLSGLAVPASPQQQARYFEQNLKTLLSDSIHAVFVHRWRDAPLENPSPARDLRAPSVDRYGLYELDGTPRPAYGVVSGLYTGEQSVFALYRGEGAPDGASWSTILGWCLLAALAIFYAMSPRFRHMIPRYFQAHFFFRESVREGREVLFGANSMLLAVIAMSCGLIGYVLLDAFRSTDAFTLFIQWLPDGLQNAIVTLLATPWALVILIASGYVLGILAWTTILSVISHTGYDLAPPQALMIVIWPRWPLLILLVAAMSLAASEPVPLEGYGLLLAAWMLVEFVAMIRSVYDFMAITRVRVALLLPALVFYPGTIILGALAILTASHGARVAFLWHALTRI